MPRSPRLTADKTAYIIKLFNWRYDNTGRHPNYIHDESSEKIQIPYSGKKTLNDRTLRSIFEEASLLWVYEKMRQGMSPKEIRKQWSGSLLQP